ncbi:MAG: PAS domain-containing protein [Chitinispirillaceae bacterium]
MTTRPGETLRESEGRFRKIVELAPIAMAIVGMDGVIEFINHKAVEVFGYLPEDIPNMDRWWVQAYPDEEYRKEVVTAWMALVQSAVTENREIVGHDYRVTCKDRTVKTMFISGVPVSGKIFVLFDDMTERRRAESQREAAIGAIRLRESYLSAIIENQPGLLWMKDLDGKFLAVNAKFAKSCGLDDPELLVGKTDFDIWPQALAAGYVADDNKVIQSGKPFMVEEPISDKGDVRWFETFKAPIKDTQGTVIGTTGYSRDITERKRMEEELQKAQKLDSLGILAGGIAHDFNNLLTGIYGYIELVRSVSKDEKAVEYLEETIATMARARALTQQLLTFAKGGAPVQRITPLLPLIQETVRFALSGSNVSCRFSLAKDLRQCNIDKNQIGQVIDNIIINAQQAMPDGGCIDVSAINVSLEGKERPSLAKGDYVMIAIRDRGIGMPKEVVHRIFDPFYTTKAKGHGLGLATCYSIIKRHGGYIDVESEPGKGSTFRVYLPASMEPVVADTATIVKHRGVGTIMVMDDEEVIRNTLRKMLEPMGYAVVCKNDGKEAIDFYLAETKAKRRFAAMIFDLTIAGGTGGIEAVAAIRKLNKEIPVFVVSGYTDDPVMNNPAAYGFTASICKPFTIAELSEMLNRFIKN